MALVALLKNLLQMHTIPIQYFHLIVLCIFLDSTNEMEWNEINYCLPVPEDMEEINQLIEITLRITFA